MNWSLSTFFLHLPHTQSCGFTGCCNHGQSLCQVLAKIKPTIDAVSISQGLILSETRRGTCLVFWYIHIARIHEPSAITPFKQFSFAPSRMASPGVASTRGGSSTVGGPTPEEEAEQQIRTLDAINMQKVSEDCKSCAP